MEMACATHSYTKDAISYQFKVNTPKLRKVIDCGIGDDSSYRQRDRKTDVWLDWLKFGLISKKRKYCYWLRTTFVMATYCVINSNKMHPCLILNNDEWCLTRQYFPRYGSRFKENTTTKPLWAMSMKSIFNKNRLAVTQLSFIHWQ